jgi:hypothetical protein
MKAVMIGGPHEGTVIDGVSALSEILGFAIPPEIDPVTWLLPDHEAAGATWKTANYRRKGSVTWPGEVVEIYAFEGMS